MNRTAIALATGALLAFAGLAAANEDRAVVKSTTTTATQQTTTTTTKPDFATLDVNFNWKFRQNTELFGSISNLLDTKPPIDPMTYGAIGYNPLDYSGAVGRYFRVGLKHKF